MKSGEKIVLVKFKEPGLGMPEQRIMPWSKYDELRNKGVDCRAVEEKVY